jgi:hypothetical protein
MNPLINNLVPKGKAVKPPPAELDSLDANEYPHVKELHEKEQKLKADIEERDTRIHKLAAKIVAQSNSPADVAKASFAAKLRGESIEAVPVHELKQERKALINEQEQAKGDLRITTAELALAKEYYGAKIRAKARPLHVACRVKQFEYLVGLAHERQNEINLLNTLERGDVGVGGDPGKSIVPNSHLFEYTPWNGTGMVCEMARELLECGYLPKSSPLLAGVNWQGEETSEFEIKARAKQQHTSWIKTLLG